MSSKILLINQSTGYLFIDIANAFADKYDEVILLAGEVLPMNEQLSAKIKVEKIALYDRRSTSKRILSWIKALINSWQIIRSKHQDADLFISSNPPTASTVLPLLFKKRKTNLLIYDIYPDGLIAGKFITDKNIIFKIWSRLNKRAYKKVNKIFTLTPGMASAMSHYASGNKIKVVPAWSAVSEGSIVSQNENLFVKQFGLEGKFIVMYSGNLGKEYELESLINAAEKLKENKDIVFIIMGQGWKKETLQKMIGERGLGNCLLLPYQPADLFLHSLSAFHVGVVSLASSVAKVAIPSKTYNLLAAQKPILCIGSTASDLANFLASNKIGIAAEPNDVDAICNYINQLFSDKTYFNQICGNASTVAKSYTRERAKEIVELAVR